MNQKIYLRKMSTDKLVFDSIFIKQHLSKGSKNIEYIIDLGANIGLSSLYFRKFNPKALIIAVEPDPINFPLLVRNTSNSNIILVQKGIWSKKANFFIDSNKLGTYESHLIKIDDEQKDTTKPGVVSCTTIEDILNTFNFPHIDLLKVDIEGAEKELFSEGYNFWLKKTRCIIIELHDRLIPGCGEVFLKAITSCWENLLWTKKQMFL